jgi:hypothetical protein
MKIGWYMLAVPLILLFLSIIVSMIVSGRGDAVNPVVRLIGMALVFSWALSIFPLVIGLVKILLEKTAKGGKTSGPQEK